MYDKLVINRFESDMGLVLSDMMRSLMLERINSVVNYTKEKVTHGRGKKKYNSLSYSDFVLHSGIAHMIEFDSTRLSKYNNIITDCRVHSVVDESVVGSIYNVVQKKGSHPVQALESYCKFVRQEFHAVESSCHMDIKGNPELAIVVNKILTDTGMNPSHISLDIKSLTNVPLRSSTIEECYLELDIYRNIEMPKMKAHTTVATSLLRHAIDTYIKVYGLYRIPFHDISTMGHVIGEQFMPTPMNRLLDYLESMV